MSVSANNDTAAASEAPVPEKAIALVTGEIQAEEKVVEAQPTVVAAVDSGTSKSADEKNTDEVVQANAPDAESKPSTETCDGAAPTKKVVATTKVDAPEEEELPKDTDADVAVTKSTAFEPPTEKILKEVASNNSPAKSEAEDAPAAAVAPTATVNKEEESPSKKRTADEAAVADEDKEGSPAKKNNVEPAAKAEELAAEEGEEAEQPISTKLDSEFIMEEIDEHVVARIAEEEKKGDPAASAAADELLVEGKKIEDAAKVDAVACADASVHQQ